ncbi:MAG: hypothetical protein ISQ09_13985 [Rubripirellula sp.]|nr:hypothetical protein [Rubripirellula sp.]
MQNDRSLAAFSGQFVSLKIVTDNNPDWAQWSRKYPMKGNSIPQLYVVRADGEQLFGGAGSLPGDALPLMLRSTLSRAGRSFDPQQAAFLRRKVSEAEEALAARHYLAAGLRLSELSQLGNPDDLQSYAEQALKAAMLFEDLRSKMDRIAEETRTKLTDQAGGDVLGAMLALSEIEAVFRMFPKWRADANSVTREFAKDDRYADATQHAAAIVQARLAAASSEVRVMARAENLYASVLRKYPGTEAAVIAKKELLELKPDSKIIENMAEGSESGKSGLAEVAFRTWSTLQGDFQTRAKYLSHSIDRVRLEKETGEAIEVAIEILSQQDRDYLKLHKPVD